MRRSNTGRFGTLVFKWKNPRWYPNVRFLNSFGLKHPVLEWHLGNKTHLHYQNPRCIRLYLLPSEYPTHLVFGSPLYFGWTCFFSFAGTWWTISFIDATNWCCHRARAQTRPSPKSLQSRQEISTQTNLQQKYLKFYQIIISLWMQLINILFFVCFFSYQPHLRMILLSYYQKENLFLFKYRLKINITLKLSSLVLYNSNSSWSVWGNLGNTIEIQIPNIVVRSLSPNIYLCMFRRTLWL